MRAVQKAGAQHTQFTLMLYARNTLGIGEREVLVKKIQLAITVFILKQCSKQEVLGSFLFYL